MLKTAAFATLVVAEAKTYPRGYVRQEGLRNSETTIVEITDQDRQNTPQSVDWSTQGATSPVKNQGDCGSCWAFSATEGIESSIYMATGEMPVLSTQQLISCDNEDGGCNGGDLPSALDYVKDAGGIDTAADYPDTSHKKGKTGKCKWDRNEVATVTSYNYAIPPCDSGACQNQNEDDLAAAVAKYGPISICLGATDSWDEYNSGILQGKCSSNAADMNHCVQIVGFEKGSFWKVRNSWGTAWGESGFIRLPYGENACGVANEAVVVQATSSVDQVPNHARGYVRQESNEAVEVLTITDEMRQQTPNAVDWSAQGFTSPVKNQGHCGSCWAFSAVETIESAVFKATGNMPILSTQQVISCDTVDAGCNGGWPAQGYEYVEKAGGIDTASDYPDTSYETGNTGNCNWDQNEVVQVSSYKYAVEPCPSGTCKNQNQKEDDLATALATNGPLSICVNAATWDNYKSGIFEKKCTGKANAIDHCVQLVGYDKSAGFWKVRNSWATTWGEDGFIRLPYGSNACGLADEVTLVTATVSMRNATLMV